jgi:hypothetical protein
MNFSLFDFLHPPLTSRTIFPVSILLSTLFSNTLKTCSSLMYFLNGATFHAIYGVPSGISVF